MALLKPRGMILPEMLHELQLRPLDNWIYEGIVVLNTTISMLSRL